MTFGVQKTKWQLAEGEGQGADCGPEFWGGGCGEQGRSQQVQGLRTWAPISQMGGLLPGMGRAWSHSGETSGPGEGLDGGQAFGLVAVPSTWRARSCSRASAPAPSVPPTLPLQSPQLEEPHLREAFLALLAEVTCCPWLSPPPSALSSPLSLK